MREAGTGVSIMCADVSPRPGDSARAAFLKKNLSSMTANASAVRTSWHREQQLQKSHCVQSVRLGCPQHQVFAGSLYLCLIRIRQNPPYRSPKTHNTMPAPPRLSRTTLGKQVYTQGYQFCTCKMNYSLSSSIRNLPDFPALKEYSFQLLSTGSSFQKIIMSRMLPY